MSDAHDKSEGHGKKHKSHGGGHGGGHEEGHEGAPEWLISFADMVMLMMGFFVILFALNNKPAGRQPGGSDSPKTGSEEASASDKMLDFAIGVREAFNNPVNLQSTDPRDAALIKRLLSRAGQSETRDQGVKGHQQDVQSIRPSEYYAISGTIPFPENSSDMPQLGRDVVSQVAGKVRGMRLIVEVRGHVSSVEAHRGPELAMKLSTERAMAVSRALADAGVDWWQLRIVACADHDRTEAFPNTKSIDRANARVEIILTDQVVPDQVPTKYEQGGLSASAGRVSGATTAR